MPNLFQRMRSAVKAFALGQTLEPSVEYAFGGGNEHTAPAKYGEYLALSTSVYSATTLRAANLAGLPVKLYKVDAKGKKQPVIGGGLYDLLKKVNPHWTWNRLIQMTELSLCSWGQAFWVLERGPNGNQKPKEIWWARPDKMTPLVDPEKYIKGFVYRDGAREITFTPGEIIWFRYPHPMDEFTGLTPIAAARLAIEAGHAALKSNKSVFDNGYQVAGVVTPESKDTTWTKEQVDGLRSMLDRRFRGVNNAHKVAVLNHSAKIQTLGISPKDAEFLGLLKWSKQEVATAFKVAPELIGDHEHATYSNLDQAYKALWTDCLTPEAQFIESELTEQLLPLFPGEADMLELDRSEVSALQEDMTEKTAEARQWWEMGVPLNRLLQVYNPKLLPEGKEGYDHGDAPGGPMPPPSPPPTGEDEPPRTPQANEERGVFLAGKSVAFGSSEHEALWKAFDDRAKKHERRIKAKVESLFERQAEAVIKALKAGDPTKAVKAAGDFDPAEPFDMDDWNEEFAVEMLPAFERVVESAGAAVMEALLVDIDFNVSHPESRTFLRQRAQRFASHVNETTWNRLKETLIEGLDAGEGIDELTERVRGTMATRSKAHAETIARTEAIGCLNGGSLLAAKQSGVVKAKTWLSTWDERLRTHAKGDEFDHGKAHGETVPLDQPFTATGEKLMHPGADGGSAANVIGCRCTQAFVVDEGDDPEKAAIRKKAATVLAAWLARHDAHTAREAA